MVWHSAAEAVAAQLIRRRERGVPEIEAGLRAVEASWEARNYAGKMLDEDYSGLTGRY
ncbi:hypothetical protein [Arthrobacter gengyunqii]|uniref:Antitoxin VbhA domain-containing protein n=1 Tax=Arthrobacter gengyunqii TaxID=2886940 RepID=A0ABS8GEQ5_9MICC|nr:hypothetical protein [Arthrobacter gengyunqii]MCC3265035.1 hypothetical protein [Arthrobacter gengyunqii]